MESVFRMRGKTGSSGLSDELEHQHRGKVKLGFGGFWVIKKVLAVRDVNNGPLCD